MRFSHEPVSGITGFVILGSLITGIWDGGIALSGEGLRAHIQIGPERRKDWVLGPRKPAGVGAILRT
jgi:hypothetical protein